MVAHLNCTDTAIRGLTGQFAEKPTRDQSSHWLVNWRIKAYDL